MISVKAFIGKLLEQTTQAQEIADRISAGVAANYLQHELLKGFPVPCMQMRHIDLELNFAVPARQTAFFLEDPEIQKNIEFRVIEFMEALPADSDFGSFFGNDAHLTSRWKHGLANFAPRLQQVLSNPVSDAETVVYKMLLCIENYFHELAPNQLKSRVSFLLEQKLPPTPTKEGRPESIKAIVQQKVNGIVSSLDPNWGQPKTNDPLDLCFLVGATELEKFEPAALHKMKISVSASNRRWVATERNGEKVYILDRA